jgi:uncharacterized damage-inducible protein DinB
MLTETLIALFNRDLIKLKQELELYKNEKAIWHIEKGIANSAGNLCLHLVGNLNTYIGGVIGHTGYIRHRELEFTLKDISKTQLLTQIEETISIVNGSLTKLTDADLQAEYPMVVFDKPMSTEYFLVHLATHLSYHLGQVNYHRRLLDTLEI